MPYTTYGLLRALRSHQISSPSVRASVETGRPNACNLCHLDKTLQWTDDYLSAWYKTPPVSLNADQRRTAASLLWLLQGDAGQRALTAWSMGWAPAQAISGVDWMAPYLAEALQDPYDAVRFVADRSIRTIPGLEAIDYDFTAPPDQRFESARRALSGWRAARAGAAPPTRPDVLFRADGTIDADAVRRLLAARDHTPVFLNE
jgi:hypothetical protein